jgi:hypothetical protein
MKSKTNRKLNTFYSNSQYYQGFKLKGKTVYNMQIKHYILPTVAKTPRTYTFNQLNKLKESDQRNQCSNYYKHKNIQYTFFSHISSSYHFKLSERGSGSICATSKFRLRPENVLRDENSAC